MSDTVDLKTVYPLVVTPSHDGKFFQNYVLSLLNFVVQSQNAGLRMQVMLHQGESLITRARNNCVAAFLANKEWTHLFWIDSDIGFSAEAAFRLLRSGYDIAAGVYPLKRENWPEEGIAGPMTQAQLEATLTRYTVNAAPPEGAPQLDLAIQPDGFIKLNEAPTGFMVIKRSVFERLMAAYPDLNYVPDSVGVPDQGLHYRFFDVMLDPKTRRYLSEDYGFCRLWEGLGEAIHVDANSSLTHQGAKTYRGDFANALKTSLPRAVGAPSGVKLTLLGGEHLAPNAPPP